MGITQFFTYDNLTGRITTTGVIPADTLSFQNVAGQTAIGGAADEFTQYFDLSTEILADRSVPAYTIDTTTVAAYDQGTVTITGVAVGADVIVDNNSVGTADGTPIELTFYEPKTYTVRIEDFPLQDYEVDVNAN